MNRTVHGLALALSLLLPFNQALAADPHGAGLQAQASEAMPSHVQEPHPVQPAQTVHSANTAHTAHTVVPARAAAAPHATAATSSETHKPSGGFLAGLALTLGLSGLPHGLGFRVETLGHALLALLALVFLGLLGGLLLVLRWHQRRSLALPVHAGRARYAKSPAPAAMPLHSYSPDKVGNDASARPWERNTMGLNRADIPPYDPSGHGMPGFDAPAFLAMAKARFLRLQEALAQGDPRVLDELLTPEMLAAVRTQLQAPTAAAGEVVLLQAHLLDVQCQQGVCWASVEFSGLSRDSAAAGPTPFREVWSWSTPQNDPQGWRVAGVQALE